MHKIFESKRYTLIMAVGSLLLVPGYTTQAQRISSRAALGRPQQEEPQESSVPARRWFREARGYEQALELHKETGADMFVVFHREDDSRQRGLYNMLETHGLSSSQVREHLNDLVKVRLRANRRENEDLVRRFNVSWTPAVFVVKREGALRNRCMLFDWEGGRPRVLDPDDIVAVIQEQQEHDPWARPDEKETTKDEQKETTAPAGTGGN